MFDLFFYFRYLNSDSARDQFNPLGAHNRYEKK